MEFTTRKNWDNKLEANASVQLQGNRYLDVLIAKSNRNVMTVYLQGSIHNGYSREFIIFEDFHKTIALDECKRLTQKAIDNAIDTFLNEWADWAIEQAKTFYNIKQD